MIARSSNDETSALFAGLKAGENGLNPPFGLSGAAPRILESHDGGGAKSIGIIVSSLSMCGVGRTARGFGGGAFFFGGCGGMGLPDKDDMALGPPERDPDPEDVMLPLNRGGP